MALFQLDFGNSAVRSTCYMAHDRCTCHATHAHCHAVWPMLAACVYCAHKNISANHPNLFHILFIVYDP